MLSKLVFGFLIIMGIQVSAAVYTPVLTETQEKIILNRLNDFCGDSWCEGEFNLTFSSVQYHKQDNLDFYVIHFAAENSYVPNQPLNFVFCQINEIELIQKIVTSDDLHSRVEGEYELYNQVNSCISEKLTSK